MVSTATSLRATNRILATNSTDNWCHWPLIDSNKLMQHAYTPKSTKSTKKLMQINIAAWIFNGMPDMDMMVHKD